MSVTDLRRTAHSEITRRRSEYSGFVQHDFDTYAAGVLERQWGDHLALTAIADSLDLCAHVYSFTSFTTISYHSLMLHVK